MSSGSPLKHASRLLKPGSPLSHTVSVLWLDQGFEEDIKVHHIKMKRLL